MTVEHKRLEKWALIAFCSLCIGAGCSTTDDDGGADDVAASTSSDTGSAPSSPAADSTSASAPGSSTGAAPLADGEACIDSEDCANQCYFLPMIGGTCGECSADADCPGGGCSPPGFSEPALPLCNDGSLSSACETDDACQDSLSCSVVLDIGTFAIRGCSSCSADEDCGEGEQCNMELELGSISGYRQCVAEASVEVGRTCSVDVSCITGICSEVDLMSTVVGVCSECREDSDCEAGSTCMGATVDMSTLSLIPGMCE